MPPSDDYGSMSAPESLLPCPFCGGEALYISRPKSAEVHCLPCTASVSEATKAEAIAAWNTRAATTSNSAMVGELVEALEGFVKSIRGRNTLEKTLTINHDELVSLVCRAESLLARVKASEVQP